LCGSNRVGRVVIVGKFDVLFDGSSELHQWQWVAEGRGSGIESVRSILGFLVFSVFLVIGIIISFVVIDISIGKSSSPLLAASAVDCVSGVMLLRVETMVLEQWRAQTIVFLIFLIFTVVGSSSSSFIIVIGCIISVVCWWGVLLCWVSMLGVGPRDQKRILQCNASRLTHAGVPGTLAPL